MNRERHPTLVAAQVGRHRSNRRVPVGRLAVPIVVVAVGRLQRGEGDRLLHRDLHVAGRPAAPLLKDQRHRRFSGRDRDLFVGQVARRPERRVFGQPVQHQMPARRDRGQIGHRLVIVARFAVAPEHTVDHGNLARPGVAVGQPRRQRGVGPQRGEHDIALRDQRRQRRPDRRILGVDGQAALAAVVEQVCVAALDIALRVIEKRRPPPQRVAAGMLDADHVGPEVGEQPRAVRQRLVGQVEDARPVQQSVGHALSSLRRHFQSVPAPPVGQKRAVRRLVLSTTIGARQTARSRR